MFARAQVAHCSVALGALLVFSLCPRALLAQNPPGGDGQTPTFEVASVKPNRTGDPGVRFGMQPGGRFNAVNAPLRELIRMAFNVQPFQIEGGPGWVGAERFDITAKAAGDVGLTGPGQIGPVQLMMQGLLADRFKLKVRRETKEMPIYALVLARADGQLGTQIAASTVDCAAQMRSRAGGPGRQGLPPQGTPGERPQCGMMMGFATIAGGDVTMEQVAQLLSTRVGRIVVDKTGLTGKYSFNVEFTPDQMPPPGALPPGAQLPPIDQDGPTLVTAIQEQLGLKLDAQRGPVETLVIESIERPTPD